LHVNIYHNAQGPAGEKGERGDSEFPFYDGKDAERVRIATYCLHRMPHNSLTHVFNTIPYHKNDDDDDDDDTGPIVATRPVANPYNRYLPRPQRLGLILCFWPIWWVGYAVFLVIRIAETHISAMKLPL